MKKIKPINEKPLRDRTRQGLSLFQCDPKTGDVYKVPVRDKFHASELLSNPREIIGEGKSMAVINQEHLICWALNKKNAVRKFRKQLNLPNSLIEVVGQMQTITNQAMPNK